MTEYNYWRWFCRGSGDKPGYRKFLNIWLFVHLGIGTMLGAIVEVPIHEAANLILLPLAGILVGLSFAWAGNAQGLMQTEEIEELSKHKKGGLVDYVYTYQTAILVILVTMTLWGLAGLRVFDLTLPVPYNVLGAFALASFLFTLSSITLRECWHVVMGAQWMLLARGQIRARRNQQQDD